MRSRILIGLILGALGGLAGAFLQENLINYNQHIVPSMIPGQSPVVLETTAREGMILICCVGGLIGLALGMIEGLVEGNRHKLVLGMVLGVVSGIVLGGIGYTMANIVYSALGGASTQGSNGPGGFLQQIIARSVGWAFFGMFLGIGAGLPTRSPARIRNGAIGGLIGGFLGGFVFDMLAITSSIPMAAAGARGTYDAGGVSRLVGFTAIGAATGFFIGLIDELTKQAWVRVLAGKNEGKDYILSRAMSIIGRDEKCDVPLYGDITIGIQHAAIRAEPRRHVIIDAGIPFGTIVNGQKLEPQKEQLLRDGDMIQIGRYRLEFREKSTARRVAPGPLDAPRGVTPVGSTPIPAHLCPFCGAPKNGPNGCLCSISDSVPASAAMPMQPAPPISGQVMGGMPLQPLGGSPMAPPMQPLGGASAPSMQPLGGGQMLPPMPGMAAEPFVPPLSGADPGGYAPAGYAPGPMSGYVSGPPTRLTGFEGPYAGQVFPILSPNMTLGREPMLNVVLSQDINVSRKHAYFQVSEAGLFVYDNNSSNGTWVNGNRITSVGLQMGDVIQFGSSKFRLE